MRRTRLLFFSIFLIVLLAANILAWGIILERGGHPVLTVIFFDVGQGDAIFIEAPNGNQMLIDGGAGSRVTRALGKELGFFDRYIDVLVATHPDADHLGGLLEVLKRYDSGVALVSGAEADGVIDENFASLLSKKGIQKKQAQGGMTIDLGDGVVFEIISPANGIDTSALESNASSVVGKLSYGGTSFLLTGDASQSIEEHLAFQYGKQLRSEVLKVGHHGSDTSTSKVFLSAVDPEAAVISVGADNRYGHPDEGVVSRITESGSEIFITSGEGNVAFTSDGRKVSHVK